MSAGLLNLTRHPTHLITSILPPVSTLSSLIYFLNVPITMQSLYAKKVEVDDYKVFCIAKVEIVDQRYTLVGIMGGWWVLEMTSLRSALSGFRRRTLQVLETAVSGEV